MQFVFREDRYAHEVWFDDGSAWVCALQSVEDSPAEAWPASPPWQSLHLESRPDQRPLALLVGMAGKNHWSASIDCRPIVPIQGIPSSFGRLPRSSLSWAFMMTIMSTPRDLSSRYPPVTLE